MSKFVFQLGQISRHFYIQGVSFDFTDNGCFTVVCAVQWVKGKKQKNAYGLGLGCWRISRHFYIQGISFDLTDNSYFTVVCAVQ